MSKINLDNTIQKIASTSKDIFIDYLMEEKKEREKKIEAVIEWVHKENSEGSFRYDVYSNLIDMLGDLKK